MTCGRWSVHWNFDVWTLKICVIEYTSVELSFTHAWQSYVRLQRLQEARHKARLSILDTFLRLMFERLDDLSLQIFSLPLGVFLMCQLQVSKQFWSGCLYINRTPSSSSKRELSREWHQSMDLNPGFRRSVDHSKTQFFGIEKDLKYLSSEHFKAVKKLSSTHVAELYGNIDPLQTRTLLLKETHCRKKLDVSSLEKVVECV